MGIYLIVDSCLDLLKGDHPPIGMVELFDWQVWLGWLMIAALVWSAVPAVILGHMKKRLAAELHDKVLHADAQMNRADWMTATAAMIGVIGIGLGLWYLDAVAAIVIGSDILRDGVKYSRGAVADILDGQPRRHDEEGTHPLIEHVRDTVRELDWVHDAAVRMRELGHLFSVEVLAVPIDEEGLLDRIERATAQIRELDWKLQDVTVAVVRELDAAPREILVGERAGQRADRAIGGRHRPRGALPGCADARSAVRERRADEDDRVPVQSAPRHGGGELVQAAGQDDLLRPGHAVRDGAARVWLVAAGDQLALQLLRALSDHEQRHRRVVARKLANRHRVASPLREDQRAR